MSRNKGEFHTELTESTEKKEEEYFIRKTGTQEINKSSFDSFVFSLQVFCLPKKRAGVVSPALKYSVIIMLIKNQQPSDARVPT